MAKSSRSPQRGTIDQQELLDHILDAWGGAQQLAQDLKKAYDSSKEGSSTRAQILQFVMGKMAKGGEAEEDLGHLSQAELLTEIRRLVGETPEAVPEDSDETGGPSEQIVDDDATELEGEKDAGPEQSEPAEPDDPYAGV